MYKTKIKKYEVDNPDCDPEILVNIFFLDGNGMSQILKE